jgi:NDP-sugar pyrophosphorylase family protein
LEIIGIYPPYIYSVSYDEESEDEFHRLFRYWNDVDEVNQFMEANQMYLRASIFKDAHEPEEATRQVLREASELEELFEDLYKNVKMGKKPDYDTFFKYLEGKYKFVTEWVPMKSYGPIRPSLLRIYAIKMNPNTYLVTGGGIKLTDTIQNSPGLKDHVIQNLDRVRKFLRENGISDSDDMTN